VSKYFRCSLNGVPVVLVVAVFIPSPTQIGNRGPGRELKLEWGMGRVANKNDERNLDDTELFKPILSPAYEWDRGGGGSLFGVINPTESLRTQALSPPFPPVHRDSADCAAITAHRARGVTLYLPPSPPHTRDTRHHNKTHTNMRDGARNKASATHECTYGCIYRHMRTHA